MLDFEGDMSEPSWRSMHQVVFEKEDDDMTKLDSTMNSVSISDWESNIYANVSASFNAPQSVEYYSSPGSDIYFCNAISMRGHL